MRDHQLGRISVPDLARMDLDEGDPGQVARLERRVEGLQRQLREASDAMTPPEKRRQDAVQEAASRAQAILDEVAALRAEEDAAAASARATMREERQRFYAGRGGIPFGGSGAAEPVTEADCEICTAARAQEAQRASSSHSEITRAADADGMGQRGTLPGPVSYR